MGRSANPFLWFRTFFHPLPSPPPPVSVSSVLNFRVHPTDRVPPAIAISPRTSHRLPQTGGCSTAGSVSCKRL